MNVKVDGPAPTIQRLPEDESTSASVVIIESARQISARLGFMPEPYLLALAQ